MTDSSGSPPPGFAPSQRSIGLGTWRHDRARTFTASTFMLIHFDSPAGSSPPGFLAGSQTITQEITLTDVDRFTAVASTQFFNTAGQRSRAGSFHGGRSTPAIAARCGAASEPARPCILHHREGNSPRTGRRSRPRRRSATLSEVHQSVTIPKFAFDSQRRHCHNRQQRAIEISAVAAESLRSSSGCQRPPRSGHCRRRARPGCRPSPAPVQPGHCSGGENPADHSA